MTTLPIFSACRTVAGFLLPFFLNAKMHFVIVGALVPVA